jgi:hypothetical protein
MRGPIGVWERGLSMSRISAAAALGATLVLVALAAPERAPAAFTFAQDQFAFNVGNQPFQVAAGDVTGDGRPDVGVAVGNPSTVTLLQRNAANTQFVAHTGSPFAVGGGANGLVFTDFNQDTRMDFAASGYTGDNIKLFLRQANGTYAAPSTIAAPNAGALATADFNGDGWPDLAYTDFDNGQLVILKWNTMTSTFDVEGTGYNTNNSPRNIAVGDLNGDNKPDAIVTNNGSSNVSVFLRNAAGTAYGAATVIGTGTNPSGVVMADFNNDTKMDFAVSNFGSNTVQTFLGDGSGTTYVQDAGSPIDFGINSGPNGLAVGDLDLDGRKDLAVTNDTADKVSILRRNNSLSGFTKEDPPSLGGTDGATSVAIFDWNGDTRPDLAVSNRDANTLLLLRSTTTIPAPINTVRPQISGTPRVGSQLSCTPGTWEGNPSSFTYVWDRAPRSTASANDPAWVPINGASGTTYTVQAADASSRVRCRVGAVNGFGSGESKSDSLRADVDVPANTRAPTVVGLSVTGQILTCDPGDWTNGADLSYRWLRDGSVMSGETGTTYQTINSIAGDLDDRISCEVTGSNDVGSGGAARSNALHVVSDPPTNFIAPNLTVSGSNTRPVGRVATCNPGSWTKDDRAYRFAWDRNGSEIPGVTGGTYTTTPNDLGVDLRCRVANSNAAGSSGFATSNSVKLALPPGTASSQILRSEPRNEFDPVNMLALSADYRLAVGAIVAQRMKAAVAKETDSCRDRKDLPAKAPAYTKKDFPLTPVKRCVVLVRDPGAVDVGSFGVQYLLFKAGKGARAAQEAPCSSAGRGDCPDMGFAIDPIDPSKPGSLSDAELATLEGATPERILWDLNRDGRTDVECPATAPVMRTMLGSGRWDVHAVIVTKDSSVTNVFGSADVRYDHFGSQYKTLRKAQAFACRTSLDPPPDPETGPCMTKGTIARVSITGNFCPVYLRALDPDVIKNLPPDVFNLLKKLSQGLPLHKRVAGDGMIHVPVSTPSIWRAVNLSAGDRATTATFTNYGSSIVSLNRPAISATAIADVKGALAKLLNFDTTKQNFALDQIYWAKGPVTVNGVTVDPTGNLPTLLVPTEAKEALSTIKTMIINTPEAQMGLACGKTPSFKTCGLPLAEKTGLNATLNEAKDAGTAFLKDKFDLDALSSSLKAKAAELTKPFKLSGFDANVKLEPDGTATLTALAEVPVLKNDNGKPITLTITLSGDQDGNVSLKGIRLGPVGAKLGGVSLQDVVVQYDDAGLLIQGKFLFPPGNQGIEINRFAITKQGKFDGLDLAYLSGAGQGIPIAAVPGTYITKIQGGISQIGPPTKIGAGVGVSVGPSAGGGCPTVGVDARIDLSFGGQPVFSADAVANVIVMCLKLGQLTFHADSSGYVRIDGSASFNEGPLSVGVKMGAAVDVNRGWQFTGSASLALKDLPIVGDIGPIGGEFALSNRGIAACVKIPMPLFIPDFSGGMGVRFPGGIPPLNIIALIANLDIFLGCDLSDYRPLGRSVIARGAQAGSSTFTLPKDTKNGMLSIEGAGGAPRVKLISPSGKVLDFTTATSPVIAQPGYGQIVEKQDRTIVFFGGAETGKWTVEPAPGSPTIARIQIKRILPKPKVTAKVGRRGTSRTLSYAISGPAGQEVRFVEQATGAAKVLKTVSTTGRGSFTFTPGEAKSAKRTIVAQVSQDGLPRQTFTLASYSAPNPTVGRPGRVKITRKGSRATITWRKATLAAHYEVGVANSTTGGRNVFFPKKGKLTAVVPGVGGKDRLTVTVIAVSPAGRKSAPGRATLAAPKAKKKKKGKK